MLKKFDTKTLDEILNRMVETVGSSKNEIFRIEEQCRVEFQTLTDELKDLQQRISKIIDKVNRLENKSRLARKKLSDVSMNFNKYTEIEVREAYEYAHELQMELLMSRHIEKDLRKRRDEIERRLVGLNETIDRAEHLIAQISVVLKYLTSDLKQVGMVLEDAKLKQDFSLRIIQAQEEERKRLSREIHDGPAQMMANVLMRSDLIEKVFNEYGPEEALKEVKSMKKMVRSALYEVRRIIYDLRPMALDDLGLIPTLRKYLQTIGEYHPQTEITFQNVGFEKRLPTKYEVALFRLVQESVHNALKHANAREIKVKLEITEERISILVKDDGKGFDVDAKRENSFGIMGMKERVDLLDGNLTIESKIGKGTLVLIQVPLLHSIKT